MVSLLYLLDWIDLKYDSGNEGNGNLDPKEKGVGRGKAWMLSSEYYRLLCCCATDRAVGKDNRMPEDPN